MELVKRTIMKKVVLFLVLMLLVSCSGIFSSPTMILSDTVIPPETATPVPTRTLIPSTPIYDYVALGDSTPAGFDVDASYVDYYARYVESDLGVSVNVLNWARDGQTAHSLLRALRDNPSLREDISNAEIVTIWTGWNDLFGLAGKYRTEECGGVDNLDCIREKVDALNADIEAIVVEILALRGPSDTLVLIANVGNPFAAQWKQVGIFEGLKGPLVDAWLYPIERVATENGIVLVDSYTVLNGPNGDDEVSTDIVIQRVHFNESGHRLLADLHREAGYGPLGP
jgi:lysophospholipase L1-like esterase